MPPLIWPDGPHLAVTITFAGWLVLFVLAYGTRVRPARVDTVPALAAVVALVREPSSYVDSRAA